MLTDRKKVVIDHILESRENALAAQEVHHAFTTAQRHLISNVLKQVTNRLKMQPYGADLVVEENGFAASDAPWQRYIAFLVRPTGWPDGIRVGFMAEATQARHISVGVNTRQEHLPLPVEAARALDALPVGPDEPYPNWPWWYWLEGSYAHWMERAGLERFLPPSNAFGEVAPAVDDLFTMLHDIIELVDPHLATLT